MRLALPRTALTIALALAAIPALSAPDPARAAGLPIPVNDTRDAVDTSIGDGLCRTSAGTCTLRAAIQEANALLGPDTIDLPAGVYELEIPTLNEDLASTGDHDVVDSLTIAGAGAGVTIVDGGWPLPGAPPEQRGLDRLLEIHPSAGNVSLSGLTLREGYAEESGGAIQNWSPGLLRLDRVRVLDSYAAKAGGGVNNDDPFAYPWPSGSLPPTATIPSGRVEIVDSTLSGNAASEGGAAVNNVSNGTVSILAGSDVVGNPGEMIPDPAQVIDPFDPEPPELIPAPGVYEPGASAIVNQGELEGLGTIRIADSTVADNYAPHDGAGILNAADGTVTIERSTIADNTTEADGAGVHAVGGMLTIADSTISGNLAHGNGAGVYSGGDVSAVGLRSRVEISDTTVADNVAWASAGGIYNDGDAAMTLTDVDVTGNSAVDSGGGLSSHGRSSLDVVRATFAGNSAEDEGGGAFVASERPVRIAGSAFRANSAGVPGLEGNDAGGGGLYTEGGPVEVTGTTISDNTATAEGGGLSIDNHGAMTVTDTAVRSNSTVMSGGGVENSGMRVTFERVTVSGNRATLDGGGIHNSSSGEFTVLDTTMRENRAMSGGGFTNASDSTLIMRRSLIHANTAKRPAASEDPEEGGLGGGFYSVSDGGGLMENTTISGNRANVRGGGMYHDADADFKVVNTTVWRNSAPLGGGVSTVESDFVPSIPPQPNPLTLKNTIVAGSLEGGSCDAYVTSEGGNLAGHHTCFISVPGSDLQLGGVRDRQGANPALDALADNGGATLTHAPRYGSFAIDGGVGPCPETDARLVARPQNGRCDTGAFEFAGPPPPTDTEPPDTQYLSGPVQDSLETNAFHFTGSDDLTPTEELIYECRLIEHDLTEAPEPISPFEALDPELIFQSCSSGWQTELLEEGLYTFEVRAIDRAGQEDPTPAVFTFNGMDTNPPDTVIAEKPPLVTSSRAATFTFSGVDNGTPAPFLEYECRLDSRDPELWLECFNPTFYSNLASGTHTLEVRALDGNENFDPTPARYTWTVGVGTGPSGAVDCDTANITLTATADGWVDEVNPVESYLFDQELEVRSDAEGDPTASPPEPVVGRNARTLVRFPVPTDASACRLESATLRLHADGMTEGRTLEAVPLAGPFKESTLTWSSQPDTLNATPAATSAGEGYREWDVKAHVEAMLESGVSHGWQIRDASESDLVEGGDQSFASRETPQDPPETTLPELKLRYEADPTPPPVPPTLPPGTPPTTVHCGQVLTESTLVGNDLDNCPGEGLVVGASNIVVDLGGHTIDGPDYLIENATGQEEGFPAGIRVSGRTNVIVRNGTVQQFGWGVLLSSGATHNVVDGLEIQRHAVAGVELFDADDGRDGNTIQNSTIEDNELGVLLGAGSENSVVRDNEINGNLGEQVFIHLSDGHRIEGNSMHGIPSDPQLDSDGGVLLEGSSDNVLVGNTIRDTGDAGVTIHMGSHRNVVEGGTYFRNGDAGVIVNDSERNRVLGITSHQQSDGGVVLGNAPDTEVRDSDLRFNPSGVEASNSNGLLIEGNDASDSLQTGFEVGNGVGIRILDNVAHRSGGAGIGMEGGAFDAFGLPVGGALIEGNRTNQNGESGILVADGGHTVRANTAHSNAGFGIDAGENPEILGDPFPGTNVDGGGNEANGNVELEQCRGVVCLAGDPAALVAPDTTAPVTVIDQAPADPSGGDVTFAFSADDATPDGAAHSPTTAMEYECRLDPLPDPLPELEPPDLEPPNPGEPPDVDTPPDGEGWIECMSPVTFRDLDEGEHHFEVRATDFADNKDLTPATHDWHVELRPEEEGPGTLAPDTRIASGPPSVTDASSATFRFTGSDDTTPGPDMRFECKLDPPGPDAGAWESCTTPRAYAGLAVGVHTFEVRALDRSGNADPEPAARTWTIQAPPPDTVPPGTTIDSGPDRTTVQRNASFAFSSDDPGATFECKLDNQPAFGACTSPHELTGVPVGDRVLEVRAKDQAGNVDPSPASFDWTVSAAPVPTFVHCGQVLTQSTLVRNDLVDCLFNGLVIGANGITVDLDGHTIDGKGLGSGVRNDGFDNVTIRNGKVVDFDWGVSLNTGTRRNVVEQIRPEMTQEAGIGLGHQPQPDPALPVEPPDPFPSADSGVRDNVVRDNTIVGNSRGIWLTANTQGTLVRGNALTATSDDAIWLERSHHNRVEQNQIAASSGAGVALEGSTHNTVVDNEMEDNNSGVRLDVTHTPPVDVQSNDNRVERNLIEESGGLDVIESDRNHLVENVVRRANDSGVGLEYARDNVIRGNDVRANKSGITLKSATGNAIEANDASDSESTGISLEAQSFGNDLVRNQSSNNDGDGIYVGDEAPAGTGMLIEGNVTNNNKSYGIQVPKPSHIIKGNSANDNGSWGIYAGLPSNGRANVDAGGNRAQGNLGPLDPITLQPQQCHLVECAGGPPILADSVPPDTQLLEHPSNPSTAEVALFRFSGTDNASDITFECALDGASESASFAPCASPATFEGLTLGLHHLRVRAVDASGNVDASPATYSWTVAAQPVGTPPETTIESGPELTTAQADASFDFHASERNSTFECKLDAGEFAPCAWTGVPGVLTGTGGSISYPGLSVGTHTFQVRATDLDANVDLTPATWTWRVTDPPIPTDAVCGQFVTESIVLTSDLIDCPGNGLVVGAHDITIDLDGHVVDGTGLDAGILNSGFDSVTITGGHVHEFDYGVQLNPGTALNVVTGMRVENNQEAGIGLSDADQNGQGNTVRDNEIAANSYGVGVLGGTRHAVVRDNSFGANMDDAVHLEQASQVRIESNEIVRSGGAGVFMQGGGDNVVVGNVLTTNGEGVVVGEELIPSNRNVVEHNAIEESNGAGVAVNDSSGTQVIDNDVRESNGAGIALDIARGTVVRGNDLRSSGAGIELSESTNNLIESNNAGGTLGTGISIEGLSFDNDVIDNLASGNGGEGIEVADNAPAGQGNVLEGNAADANGGDGIIVEGAGHSLKDNSVQLNGGWGIYAPVGAIDGGGNFAAGNVEPGQCVGVVCTRGTAPGSPETTILEKPPTISHSRNASFTYIGRDDSTPLVNLVFECRLDSTNDLAWEDCEYPHEVRNLSPGMHTLDVRAVDLGELADDTPASYTWEYRPLPAGVAPQAFIDMKPEAETWAFESIFTFHSNEPDVTFECKVDLNPWEDCGFETVAHMNQGGFEWGLEETEVGPHTFSVRATDFEGNVGQPATYTWRLLGTVTQFLSGPGFTPGTEGEPATGGEVQSSTATIDFQANVADATYECSLDLEPFEPCSPPVTYTGLLAGDHELRVVATDENGVSELEPAIYEWEVLEPFDDVAPETTLERAPADGSSSTIFEFAGSDDQTPPVLITFECRIDSTSELDWEPCENPYNLLDHYTYADFQLAPGPHVFEVRAVDAFEPLFPDPANPDFEGNVDPTPARHVWTSTADADPPGTGIAAGPSGKTADTEATFEFFGTDNATPAHLMDFECSVDGAPFEPCGSPETVSLEPGTHTFRMRSVDLAGNPDPTPATRTWEIVAAPVATFTSGPEGRILPGQSSPPAPSTSDRAIFTFASDQPDATFECSLDGAEFAPCTSPYAAWLVEDGTHELEVRGVSSIRTAEGEPIVQDPPSSYEWRAEIGPDGTRPDTRVTAGPPASTLDSVATFQFTGDDNRTPPELLTFECALDGQAFSSCTSPEQFSDMTHGPHELLVRARDVAGNFDATPARYTWDVALPPVVTISGGPDEVTESTDAEFSFSSNVPGSTFKCWLDGAITDCTSPKSYSGLAGGEHLFAVLATSPAGHTSLQWEEWEWTVGPTEAPITTFHSGPDVTTHDTRAEFAFSADKPGSTFTCSLDGADFVPCSSPLVYPRLHPGQHRLEVLAAAPPLLDPFGVPIEPDYEEVPAVYEWEILDDVAPNASIDWGPQATTASLNAVFGLSSDDPTAVLECSLDGEGFNECDPVAEFTDLERGEHTLQLRAVDPIGNVDPTPATFHWTIVEPGAPNTPVGTNVTVELPMPDGPGTASVNFFEVNGAGVTTVDALTGGPELPAGYTQGGARFYDIGTTAEFGEPATLCLAYDPGRYQTSAVRLLQSDGSTWLDVTTINNPFTGRICASEAELRSGESSLFTIAAANTGIAPLVSILSGPPPVANSGTATFELFADMPDAQIQCSIDGLPFEPCTSPVTYTHLEEGDHDFQVQAMSVFGIPPLVPTLYEWEVVLPPDVTPPSTTITRGPPAHTASFINWLEFTGSDDQTAELEMEFECRVDSEPFESCDVPHEVEVLTRGPHRVEVRAVDETGNVDPTPAFRDFNVVDVSAPDTSIDSGPNSETAETTASFTYSGEEENGTIVDEFECALDDQDFVDCSDQPYTVSGLTGGPHVMYVRARDPDGNVDPTPDFYEWLVLAPIDTTPPDTVIFSGPAEGSVSGPDVMFSFLSTELAEEFECSLDNGPFEGCEGLYELTGLASGTHTLRVRAFDLAEPPNVDPSPAVRSWTVLGEPQTRIDATPPDPSFSASGTFAFSSDQTSADGVTFQCSVDGSEWTPCSSPFTAGPLIAGDPESGEEHEFEVRAVSRFVNLDGEQIVDETPARYDWTVFPAPDPPAFDTELTSTPPTVTAGGPDAIYLFSFQARDPNGQLTNLATFECSLDGEPFEECEPPLEYDGLEDGTYTLRVRAVDPALQPDATPASFTWTIEAAPETVLSSAGLPPIETESTSETFTFSSPDPDATFECALDTTTFTPCSSPQTFADVPHGDHELQVRAKSPAGSVDQTPEVHEWTSGDMTPPVVTIDSGPTLTSGATATTDGTTATFAWHSDDPDAQYLCTLSGAPDPVPPSHEQRFCSSGVTYTGLTPGVAYTFEVEPTKPFLLVSAEPAVWEWAIVDTTAPETTIESGPAARILPDAPATFAFSSNEPGASFECALDTPAGEQPQWSECAQPPANGADFSGLEAGEHTLLVRAVDVAEPPNADQSPASHTWTVIGPPSTTILSGPPADPETTTERSATFEFEADQEDVTFRCSLDGADSVPCSSPFTYTGLAAGGHELEIQATNSHDMVEEPATSHAWTIVDGDAPETAIELGPPASTLSRTATFAFSSDEADASFECALDTPAGEQPQWSECAQPPESTAELTDLAVGDHTLLVRAVDPSGNADPTPASHGWTVTAPVPDNTPVGTDVTVTVDEPGGATTATVTFGSVTAAGATTVDALAGASPLPLGYVPAGARYYDLDTTATHSGSLAVCLTYDPGSLADPVRLLRFDGSAWTDVTISDDPAAGRICGEPGGLGTFAIASATAAVVPDTSILVGPPASTVSTIASFEFDSNAAPVTYECALDTAPGAAPDFGSCEASQLFEGLLPGEHELLVRAKSELGIFDATPARHEWTVVKLDTFVDSGPDAATESTTATFDFSSDHPGPVTFECLLDDAETFEPCDATTTYSGLAQDEHELQVRARDADGNVDPTPAEWSWEIGDVPPPVTIDSGPLATTDSRSATFEFSAPEPGVTFECSLDGAEFAICSSPKHYSGLPFATHTLRVQVHSPEAIVEQEPATYTWTVADDTPPETALDLHPPALTASQSASLSFTSESGATFECSLDGADFEACESPAQYGALALGEHDFRVRAVDAAGNRDGTPASYGWTVAEPPETTIDLGPASDSTATTATFEFSSSQPDASFECSLDGGAFAACSSPHQYSGLADGDHFVEVRARSPLGIADAEPAVYEWTVDASPPQTTIPDGPDTTTEATSALFSLSANEVGVTFECSLDGAAFAECLSPHLVDGLAPGEHELRVRAIDESGNADPTPASYAWTVQTPDTIAPETTIGPSKPAATTASTTATFDFSANEPGVTFDCSLDGAAFAACTAPRQYTGLSDGQHELRVRATDAAGNVDATPASHGWRVDTTAPQTTIGAGAPPATTTSTGATFAFSADESGSTFECSLDTGPFAACTSPRAYSSLATGAHTFRVRARDGAGNVDATPATHSWTISAPAPSCTGSTVTVGAAADGWMLQDSASQNYGTDSVLKVDTKSGANARAAVRFNLPAIPSGCQVTTAKLRLYASSYKTGRTLQALRLAAPWTEGALTWGNQPATTGTAATVASGSGYREWTVTSHVQAMYSGANHGFLVRDATENGTGLDQGFHSREKGSDNPPRLVVTFAAQ
jgi:parallel beta-helix repeat protein